MLMYTINKVSDDIVCVPLNLQEYVFITTKGDTVCTVQRHQNRVVLTALGRQLVVRDVFYNLFGEDGNLLFDSAIIASELPKLYIVDNFQQRNRDLFKVLRRPE